ncbi:hypothetical protein ACT3CD_06255 [Geofilum sp. OHC36d9]|uniref:hypothetical protein n=1 Tax=Geofilum sp. OHC36d9 TaxID=3458413 RepID=UPI0040343B56
MTRIIPNKTDSYCPATLRAGGSPSRGSGGMREGLGEYYKYNNQSVYVSFDLPSGPHTMILSKAESLVALAQGIALCYDIPWFHCPERAKAKN